MTFPTKTCGKCHQSKSLNKFYKSDKGYRGRSAWCIRCHIVAKETKEREHRNALALANLRATMYTQPVAHSGSWTTREKFLVAFVVLQGIGALLAIAVWL